MYIRQIFQSLFTKNAIKLFEIAKEQMITNSTTPSSTAGNRIFWGCKIRFCPI